MNKIKDNWTARQTFRGRERRWRIARPLPAPRLTCPPSPGSPWAILSTVVTDTMGEHAMVLAQSIKVSNIQAIQYKSTNPFLLFFR